MGCHQLRHDQGIIHHSQLPRGDTTPLGQRSMDVGRRWNRYDMFCENTVDTRIYQDISSIFKYQNAIIESTKKKTNHCCFFGVWLHLGCKLLGTYANSRCHRVWRCLECIEIAKQLHETTTFARIAPSLHTAWLVNVSTPGNATALWKTSSRILRLPGTWYTSQEFSR